MKPIQAELWNKVTFWDDMIADARAYQTPRMIETQNLYDTMFERFARTLTPEQGDALDALEEIAASVAIYRHDSGVARGLVMAAEIRRFLDNPLEAMRQNDIYCPTVVEINKIFLRRLEEYFAGAGGQTPGEGSDTNG